MTDAVPTNPEDSVRRQFWVKRCERERQPWDLGSVLPDLVSSITRTSMAPARVLIPGSGFGCEVRPFHGAGFDVEAIEFSGPAVAHAREVLGPLGDRVIQGNYFNEKI